MLNPAVSDVINGERLLFACLFALGDNNVTKIVLQIDKKL